MKTTARLGNSRYADRAIDYVIGDSGSSGYRLQPDEPGRKRGALHSAVHDP